MGGTRTRLGNVEDARLYTYIELKCLGGNQVPMLKAILTLFTPTHTSASSGQGWNKSYGDVFMFLVHT